MCVCVCVSAFVCVCVCVCVCLCVYMYMYIYKYIYIIYIYIYAYITVMHANLFPRAISQGPDVRALVPKPGAEALQAQIPEVALPLQVSRAPRLDCQVQLESQAHAF